MNSTPRRYLVLASLATICPILEALALPPEVESLVIACEESSGVDRPVTGRLEMFRQKFERGEEAGTQTAEGEVMIDSSAFFSDLNRSSVVPGKEGRVSWRSQFYREGDWMFFRTSAYPGGEEPHWSPIEAVPSSPTINGLAADRAGLAQGMALEFTRFSSEIDLGGGIRDFLDSWEHAGGSLTLVHAGGHGNRFAILRCRPANPEGHAAEITFDMLHGAAISSVTLSHPNGTRLAETFTDYGEIAGESLPLHVEVRRYSPEGATEDGELVSLTSYRFAPDPTSKSPEPSGSIRKTAKRLIGLNPGTQVGTYVRAGETATIREATYTSEHGVSFPDNGGIGK